MSDKSIEALLEKLKTDTDFQKKVMAVETVKERIAIIQAQGFDCSAEDFKVKEGELDDEALEQVAGGWGRFCGNVGEGEWGCC